MPQYHPARDLVPHRKAPPEELARELNDRKGAEQLARELDAWWHERGFPQVRHWAQYTVTKRVRAERTVWGVRSNLVNGMPPDGPSPLRWSNRR